MSTSPRRRLKGRPACKGKAVGRPRVIREPKDLDNVEFGDILVAAETDISYVPAMQRASAIVTETGGRFCHAAVWAREHNKPAILQVEKATEMLVDVPHVDVCADTGTIEWDA